MLTQGTAIFEISEILWCATVEILARGIHISKTHDIGHIVFISGFSAMFEILKIFQIQFEYCALEFDADPTMEPSSVSKYISESVHFQCTGFTV